MLRVFFNIQTPFMSTDVQQHLRLCKILNSTILNVYNNLSNLMFFGPHKMKMSHYFSVFDTLWNLGLF